MNNTKKVLNTGFVRLVELMGNDMSVVQAARVSYGDESKGPEKDKKLIEFLLKNEHMSPFEHVVFKFHIKCPMFVARQWFRYRDSAFNEISGRYVEVKDEFYTPAYFRTQSGKNYEYTNMSEQDCNELSTKFNNFYTWSYNFYRKLLEKGVAKEQARMVLPQSIFTEFYWTVNGRSLMNFLHQRLDVHAQWEIRQYAETILDIFKTNLPWTAESFLKSNANC